MFGLSEEEGRQHVAPKPPHTVDTYDLLVPGISILRGQASRKKRELRIIRGELCEIANELATDRNLIDYPSPDAPDGNAKCKSVGIMLHLSPNPCVRPVCKRP